MIYHIVTKSNWQKAVAQGFYEAPSLHTEGFIHACTQQQIKGVWQRYYSNETNLLLMHINESKLHTAPVYEIAPSINEAFPHIYGFINLDAVEEISEW